MVEREKTNGKSNEKGVDLSFSPLARAVSSATKPLTASLVQFTDPNQKPGGNLRYSVTSPSPIPPLLLPVRWQPQFLLYSQFLLGLPYCERERERIRHTTC